MLIAYIFNAIVLIKYYSNQFKDSRSYSLVTDA